MKKVFVYIIISVFTGVFIGFTGSDVLEPVLCSANDMGPVLTIGNPLVKLSGESKVVFMGSGFTAGQNLNILFATSDGMFSDIGFALAPAPKADKTGSWTSIWTLGDYVDRKIIEGGVYKVTVTDNDYKPITHAPIYFQKPEK